MNARDVRGARSLTGLFANTVDPPLDLAALLIARDVDPQLDVDAWLARLDALADPVIDRVARAHDAAAQAAVLGTYLCDELGYRGDEETYYDPRNSYLHTVIESHRGIPITLSVLVIAVARRAGVTAEGVGFPGHFLTRIGGSTGVLIDPFFGARIVTPPVLDELSRRSLGGPGRVRPEHLATASTRAIVVRMLTNLKVIYEAQHDHARALVACDRLVDLAGAPEHRRDRARHSLALGAHAVATDDLEAYLAARGEADDASEMRALLDQTRAGLGKRTLQ